MLHQTLDNHIQTESRCHVNGRAAVGRLRWRQRRPLRRVNLTRTTKVGAVASYEKTGGVRIPIFDGTMNERAEIAARRDVPHIHVASMHNLKSDIETTRRQERYFSYESGGDFILLRVQCNPERRIAFLIDLIQIRTVFAQSVDDVRQTKVNGQLKCGQIKSTKRQIFN